MSTCLITNTGCSSVSTIMAIAVLGRRRGPPPQCPSAVRPGPRRVRNKRGDGHTGPSATRQGRRNRARPATRRRRGHHRRTRSCGQSAPPPSEGVDMIVVGSNRPRRFHRFAPRLGRSPCRHSRQCPRRRYRATLSARRGRPGSPAFLMASHRIVDSLVLLAVPDRRRNEDWPQISQGDETDKPVFVEDQGLSRSIADHLGQRWDQPCAALNIGTPDQAKVTHCRSVKIGAGSKSYSQILQRHHLNRPSSILHDGHTGPVSGEPGRSFTQRGGPADRGRPASHLSCSPRSRRNLTTPAARRHHDRLLSRAQQRFLSTTVAVATVREQSPTASIAATRHLTRPSA